MEDVLASAVVADATPDAPCDPRALLWLEFGPLTRAEMDAWFRGGEPVADECEAIVACSVRIRGASTSPSPRGMHALRQRNRLAQVGFRG